MHPLVSFLANILTHCLFPTRSVPSAPTATGGLTEGSVMREHPVRVREEAGEEKGRRRCLHILRKVVARCLLPNTSGSSALTRIDALTEGSVMESILYVLRKSMVRRKVNVGLYKCP